MTPTSCDAEAPQAGSKGRRRGRPAAPRIGSDGGGPPRARGRPLSLVGPLLGAVLLVVPLLLGSAVADASTGTSGTPHPTLDPETRDGTPKDCNYLTVWGGENLYVCCQEPTECEWNVEVRADGLAVT